MVDPVAGEDPCIVTNVKGTMKAKRIRHSTLSWYFYYSQR
jgi:hypothetical protein